MIGTTLGLIALGTAVAGTTISAIGQVKAGNAAGRAGDFNARMLEEQAAQVEGPLLTEDVSRFRQEVRQLIGTQRVGFAGQNVDVGTGSAREVQQDALALARSDETRLRANAAREAHGLRQEAEGARMGADAARSAGRWGAASTALGGAGSILMTTYGWQRERGRR